MYGLLVFVGEGRIFCGGRGVAVVKRTLDVAVIVLGGLGGSAPKNAL